MKEIQNIVNNKVQAMVDSGQIQKAVEDGVEKAILNAINKQFDSYGNITKQIEESLKGGLQVDTSDLPFETYNEQMLVLIKSKLDNMFQDQAAEKFLAEMDKALKPAPKEMDIHEFVETITDTWRDHETWDRNDMDNFAYVEIESPKYPISGHSLKIWKQREDRFHEAMPDLHLYVNDGKIRINHTMLYNPTCFHEHEAFVFKCYAAGTVLTGIEEYDPDDHEYILKDYDY